MAVEQNNNNIENNDSSHFHQHNLIARIESLNGLDHEHVYRLATLVVEYIFFPFRLVKFINPCGMPV